MAYQPFLIADFKTGVALNKAPWLIPAEAFQSFVNGYVEHGIIKKRQGVKFLAEMVHTLTTITGISAAATAVVTVANAALLANDMIIQISYATGGGFGGLNGGKYVIKNLVGLTFDLYKADGTTPVDTTGYGVYAGLGVVCSYPALPVMGIKTFKSTYDLRETLFWDTRRMGRYNASTETVDPIDTGDLFTGDNTNFISVGEFGKTSAFATPTLYFTSFNGDAGGAVDNMRSYIAEAIVTTPFIPDSQPTTVSHNLITAAQFIEALKQRLLLFNTVEFDGVNAVHYAQRVRWSKYLTPTLWDEITPGNGGYADAPTSDIIVSVKALQDFFLVVFSNSTWLLMPTSDPAAPFRWKKLNDFRASDTSYGTVAHDRFVISLGVRGIFASDGVETKRMDDKIERFVVEEINLDHINKVYGERNYAEKRTWFLYPSSQVDVAGNEAITSNRALIRTDDDGAWSVYTTSVLDDTGAVRHMSCLGHGNASKDYTFADFNGIVQPDYDFSEFGEERFSTYYLQGKAEIFLGGDQIGRMFVLETGGSDNDEDIDLELISASWNPYKEEGKEAQLGFVDIYADADPSTILEINFYLNTMGTPYASKTISLLPEVSFNSEIQDIIQANPVVVTSASHGLPTGTVVYIYGIGGMLEIQGGPYVVTNISENTFSLNVDSTAFTAYTGRGTVNLNPFSATKCWKRIYAGGVGYEHYMVITSSGKNQIMQIHAINPWFRATGSRLPQ